MYYNSLSLQQPNTYFSLAIAIFNEQKAKRPYEHDKRQKKRLS